MILKENNNLGVNGNKIHLQGVHQLNCLKSLDLDPLNVHAISFIIQQSWYIISVSSWILPKIFNKNELEDNSLLSVGPVGFFFWGGGVKCVSAIYKLSENIYSSPVSSSRRLANQTWLKHI